MRHSRKIMLCINSFITFLSASDPIPVDYCKTERVEYVIAHYNEDLTWLIPYADKAHVYHKGSLDLPPIEVAEWSKLPNVGREGHTYLFHIVNHYDALADITFFLQGRISDHMFGRTMDDMLREVTTQGLSFFGELLSITNCPNATKWIQNLLDKPLLTFWKIVFKERAPDPAFFYTNGCFAIRKEIIYHHPKEFYERLLETLSYASDPMEGYFLEKMWYFMFDPIAATTIQDEPRMRCEKSIR